MLLDKRSLAVQELCVDAGRYAVDSVHVEVDGTSVATDGRVLLAVEGAGLDTGEYPDVGAVDIPKDGINIPDDLAREAIKNMPSKMPREVLNACTVTKAESDEVELTTTDLKRTRRVSARTSGTFPDWRFMFDGVAKGKEHASVTLGLPLLKKIVKTLEKVAETSDDSNSVVTFQFRSPSKPVIISGYADSRGRRFLGLLSRVKASNEFTEFNDWQKGLLGLK